jgi:signal transduction histidine kinase
MSVRVAVSLWTLALLAAGGATALVLASDHEPNKLGTIALAAPAGLAFVAAGLIARVRRPENRTGTLMLLVGFAWFLGALGQSNDSILFTIGAALNFAFLPFLFHLLLAFPGGRLERRAERTVVGAMYALVVLYAASVPFFEFDEGCSPGPCPENAVLLSRDETVSAAIEATISVAAVALLAAAIVLLIRHWQKATPPLRRALAPVLLTGGAMIFLLASMVVVTAVSEEAARPLNWLGLTALLAIPLSFLFGLLRTRLAHAAVSDVVEVGRGAAADELQEAVRRALGDPDARLALWRPDRDVYVDFDGNPVRMPDDGEIEAATVIEHRGRRVAALIHDASLLENDAPLRAVSAAAGLALENEELQTELRNKLEELQASRSRIVQAGDAERRRLERNLHDGAQQRLVSLSLALRLAEAKLASDPDAAQKILADAGVELGQALDELRELARGIHPAVLSDRGLAPALASLANRAPFPVDLQALPDQRFTEPVEAAAFYVVSESLANAAKYANASTARVIVTRRDGRVLVEVEDDGVGGADPSRGSGLRGLTDRVEALNGILQIESPPGRGTRIHAEIPCV